jgi:hypothetical protein
MRDGFTLTMTEPGVVPLPGLALSHEPPEVVVENEAFELESETITRCAGGMEPPWNLKVNADGLGVSALEPVDPLTVTLTIAEWLRLPDTPVTVTPTVIGAAVLVAETVSVLVPVLLIGLRVALSPVGKPGGEKLTLLLLKPADGVMVRVDLPLAPGATVRLVGDAERLKLGAATVLTVRPTVVEWLKEPEVPVIVTVVGPPVVAVLLAASVITLLANDAVTPLGKPDAVYETVPLKPLDGVTDIVLVPLAPCATVTLFGNADRLKFGGCAAALTVRLTVAVWVSVPDEPVMVTVVGPPVVAVLLAVRVRVLAVKDAVTPLGKPEAV